MIVGSLCTGGGGFDLAMEALGHEIIWQAENDKACCTVLERHWPDTPNRGDITKVDWSDVEPVEMIFGGPPCQPISLAGKRKGSEDERWLWPYVLDAVRILRPRYCFFENPAAFLGAIEYPRGSGRWWPPPIETLVGALAEMGFDAEWGVFRASDVGAPHRRERVFILADDNHDGRKRRNREESSEGGEVRDEPRGEFGATSTDSDPGRRIGRPDDEGNISPGRGRTPRVASDPDRSRLPIDAQPNSEEEARLQAPRRGNSVGSTPAHSESKRLSGGGRHGNGGLDLRTAVADLDGGRREQRDETKRGVLQSDERTGLAFPWEKGPRDFRPAIERWAEIMGPPPWPLLESGGLNPEFAEWYMAWPIGFTNGVAKTRRIAILGNAVLPPVAVLAYAVLSERSRP